MHGLKNNLSSNRRQQLDVETVLVNHHLITVVGRLHFSPLLLRFLLLRLPDAVEETRFVRFKAVVALERTDVAAVAPVDLESSDTRARRKNVPLKLKSKTQT